ncbi:MAG: VacJ family lipoprotein [Defluviicoccus sp.]
MAAALLAALLQLATVIGCAAVPPASDREARAEFEARNDPLEPVNRRVYAFNRVVDALFLKPAAIFYRALTPPPVRNGVSNVLHNLKSPVILANDLMQAEFARAGDTAARFAINSTIGIGGLADPAADHFGIAKHGEDFGQTLAVWGVGEGPFLMLPLLGPSNPRDAVGFAVDTFVLDPFAWWVRVRNDDRALYSYVRLGMTAIDARAANFEGIEDVERNSLDPYAAMRSLYRQFRVKEINQGQAPADFDVPDFDDIPDAGPLGSTPG